MDGLWKPCMSPIRLYHHPAIIVSGNYLQYDPSNILTGFLTTPPPTSDAHPACLRGDRGQLPRGLTATVVRALTLPSVVNY